MDIRKYDYFSDEELDSFIAQIEDKPLRQAPDYLKGIILDKASKMEKNKIIPMAKAQAPMTRATARKQLFDYGVKVCAGAAAAIAIMFVIPTVNNVEQGAQQNSQIEQNMQQEDKNQDDKHVDAGTVLSSINQATSNFCSNLFDKTNEIIKGGK